MLVSLIFLLVFVLAALHAAAYLLMIFEGRAHGQGRTSAARGALWGAWLAEGGALAVVWLLKPFSWIAPRPIEACAPQRPVVLVHGWGVGHPCMGLLAARLRAEGRVAVALSYASYAAGKGQIEIAAQIVARQLRELVGAAGGGRADVVAHGLGGILVHAAARRYGVADLLANVVTVGCPHQGTALASMFAARSFGDLRPHSAYLTRLAGEAAPMESVSFTNIRSDFDALVFPPDLADCSIATNISIEYVGHYSMLFSERVYRLIAENLEADPASTATRDP